MKKMIQFEQSTRQATNSTIKSGSGGGPNLMLANKQPAPKFTWAVWDENGMVCILAKFEATISITFETPSGPQVSVRWRSRIIR